MGRLRPRGPPEGGARPAGTPFDLGRVIDAGHPVRRAF